MEYYGLKTNTYNPCIANLVINGKHMTVTWHAYDLRVYHKDPVHITKFAFYFVSMYGKEIK